MSVVGDPTLTGPSSCPVPATRAGALAVRPGRAARSVRRGIAGAVLLFLALGLLDVLAVAPFFAGDESAHANYALELSSGRLPLFDDRFGERLPGMRDTPTWTAQHPPLYYALVALPLRLGLAAGHPVGGLLVARTLTLLLGAAAVVAVAWLTTVLLPGRPDHAVGAAAVMALVPSFQQVSAMVYNDALAVLTSTVALVAAVGAVRHGCDRRRLGALVLAAVTAAAARASGLELAALCALAALTPAPAERAGPWPRRAPAAVRRAALVTGAVTAVTGWWYLRNLRLYGSLDGSTKAVPDGVPRGPSIAHNATSPRFWLDEYDQLFGYVTSNTRLYAAASVPARLLLVAVLAGLAAGMGMALAAWWRRGRPGLRGRNGLVWGLLGLHALLVLVSVLAYFARGALPFGRYFFPLLPLLPVLVVLGLDHLPGRRRGLPLALALLAGLGVGLSATVATLTAIDVRLAGVAVPARLVRALDLAGLPASALVLAGLTVLAGAGLLLVLTALSRLPRGVTG